MFQSTTPNIDDMGVAVNTCQIEDEITSLAHTKPVNLIGICQTLIASLWQRRPRYDIESMYNRDGQALTSPDPLKPTSLSGKQIADIWLLNSKR
jgi:hypothetical protein